MKDSANASLPLDAKGRADTMSAPSALVDLLARVEAAERPDREIDCALALAIDGFFLDGEDPWGRPRYCYRDAEGQVCPGHGHDMLVRRYTASLDEALALCARVLPGWFVGLQQNRHHNKPTDWTAYVERSTKNEHEATAKTPALAILAAMLKALIAQAASLQAAAS